MCEGATYSCPLTLTLLRGPNAKCIVWRAKCFGALNNTCQPQLEATRLAKHSLLFQHVCFFVVYQTPHSIDEQIHQHTKFAHAQYRFPDSYTYALIHTRDEWWYSASSLPSLRWANVTKTIISFYQCVDYWCGTCGFFGFVRVKRWCASKAYKTHNLHPFLSYPNLLNSNFVVVLLPPWHRILC